MNNTEKEKRVRICIDVDAELVAWVDSRAQRNRRARCREIEVILEEARKRDREALAECGA